MTPPRLARAPAAAEHEPRTQRDRPQPARPGHRLGHDQRSRQECVLTVENTGQKLTPQSVATLAEPFLRGTKRIRTDHAGVGLGLAIVKSITRAHDGTSSSPPAPAAGSASRCNYHGAFASKRTGLGTGLGDSTGSSGPPRASREEVDRAPKTHRPRNLPLGFFASTDDVRGARGARGRTSTPPSRSRWPRGAAPAGWLAQPPGGSSSLYALGATSLGASAWNKAARSSICPRPTPSSPMPPPYIGRRPRAACVDIEQPAQATDARRLDVHDARGQRRRADVLGAADKRVGGHALEVIAEQLRDLRQVVRVLQVGVRERTGRGTYSALQRLRILDLEPAWPLKSIADRAGRRATSSDTPAPTSPPRRA